MVTITGVAWIQSGNTATTTCVVETFDGFDIKYRVLAIPMSQSLTEEKDAIRTANWGNTLSNTIGYVIISEAGSTVKIQVQGENSYGCA